MATTQIEGSLIENSGIKPIDIDIPALEQALNLENLSGVLQIEHGGTGVDTLDELRALIGASGGRKFAITIGNGIQTTFSINHGLSSEDVIVSVRESIGSKNFVYPNIQILDTNTIQVVFGVAPTSNQYRVVIVG